MSLILILAGLGACFVLFRGWLLQPRAGAVASRHARAVAGLHASACAAVIVALACWLLLRPWALAITLDIRPMLSTGLAFGALLVVVWAAVGMQLFRGLPLRLWAPWLMVLSIAGPGLGVALARGANIALDVRAGEVLAARVVHTRMFASGRGSRSMNYQLALAGDHLSPDLIDVSWRVHRRLHEGDDIRVVRHRGAFGWAWLDRFEATSAK